MVYLYVKKSKLQKEIGMNLTINEIEETLIDMGMDLKGKSDEQDPELKIELTAEKLDLISTVGIARAIKFYRGLATKIPKYEIKKSNLQIFVENAVENIRPKTVGAIIKDIDLNKEKLDEIIELQEKIHASFGRNRKKAAIGIYPIKEIKFPLKYTAKKPEEIKFIPLGFNKETYALDILNEHETGKKYSHLLKNLDKYPLYIDSNEQILSMPPIINSEITGKVDTIHTDLFVEISGHNLTHLDNILKVLITTLIEMGGKAESIEIKYPNKDIYQLNLNPIKDSISYNKIQKIIGVSIDKEKIKTLLTKMMYQFEKQVGDDIYLEIPCFKTDAYNDIDIIDDIARAYGYNNIIPKLPNIQSVGQTLKISDFKENIKEILIGLGFLELYTYMLSSSTLHLQNMGLNPKSNTNIMLQDSEDQGINLIRTMILPDNLQSLHLNRKNKYPQKIFEIGWTIIKNEKLPNKAEDLSKLSISIADPNSNYTNIKEVLDTLFKLLNINNYSIQTKKYSFLIEGRSGEIIVNNQSIGFIGELNPQVLNNFSIIVPIASLEINLDKLFNLLK